MQSLNPILEKLARAQAGLLQEADAIGVDEWKRSPGNGAWSAAEVVAHLIMVERSILEKADRISQKQPRPIPFFKRFHMPMAMVEARVVRRKSPIPLDPGLVQAKEAMLAELRNVRERSLAFLDETKNRDLSVYCWPHPFLGMLNLYEWFQMIASHEIRHTKQMREITATLPKAVEGLQK